ncbi:hypothetical protein CLOM_g7434 [Closterium sp. NIES-68]|nr:hypothetical protein CLOM_g7434 [Closterium sp. NIES-68]
MNFELQSTTLEVDFHSKGRARAEQIVNLKTGGGKAAALFKQKDFNFEKLGIGGLDVQFADIFRRAFASRIFPPHIISR